MQNSAPRPGRYPAPADAPDARRNARGRLRGAYGEERVPPRSLFRPVRFTKKGRQGFKNTFGNGLHARIAGMRGHTRMLE